MNLSIKELNELIYSLGITATNGKLCDKELNNTLLDKLYSELNSKIILEDEDIKVGLVDVLGDANTLVDEIIDSLSNVRSHRVSNEEADGDAIQRDYSAFQKYADNQPKDRFNGVSHFILDFVEANGIVTYTEMNDMYKAYTKGSNSFSHILKALLIPYKNRPTRRFLNKMPDGRYRVNYAQQYNWVVNDVYDYND